MRRVIPWLFGAAVVGRVSSFPWSSSSVVPTLNAYGSQSLVPRITPPLTHTTGQTRGLKRLTPRCGLQITIHIRGKRTGGEDWMNSAYGEYEKRLRTTIGLETMWHKTDDEMVAAVKKISQPCICLDEKGKHVDSKAFADLVYRKLEEGGSRLSFVIGGAEGLPPELKQGSELLSLSKMTFTHQFARVVLAEQIYRAAEIRKGSSYHKE